jgi:hypothetical protein
VAESLGVSEAQISRRLARVRGRVRERLGAVVARYSLTPEDVSEPGRNGLDPNPNKTGDALFDEALGEVFQRTLRLRAAAEAELRAP